MAREVVLYKVPKTIEVARVLDDSILEPYNESVKSKYNSKKARDVLTKFEKEDPLWKDDPASKDGELKGSNIFMVVHLQNSGLLDGRRIATRGDLEKARRLGLDFRRNFGNYADFGLALRSASEPNEPLATRLVAQTKKRNMTLADGILIPVSAIDLREDPNSKYGLVFDLKEDTEKVAHECRYLKDLEWNCAHVCGLAKAYLDGSVSKHSFTSWCSDIGLLADSNDKGRVVVVSEEGTGKDFFDAKLEELKKKRDEKVADIQERYARAEKILRGK